MKYSEVQQYFEAIGIGLKKVVATYASVAEFVEVKLNLKGLTFVVEDLNWRPVNIKENPRKESVVNFQLWVPLQNYLDVTEVKVAKDLLQEQADQIVAKFLEDYADYTHFMKYLDVDSIDFLMVSDVSNKDAIGIRGECKINDPANFEIDTALWN